MRDIHKKIYNIFEDFFEQEKKRLPHFVPVGIGIGICFYFSLLEEPSFAWSVAACLLSICMIAVCRKMNRCFLFISCVLASISIGFFAAQLRTQTTNTKMLEKSIDEPVQFTATVLACDLHESGIKFVVDDVHFKNQYSHLNALNLCKLELIFKNKDAKKIYSPGDRVKFKAILYPIHEQAFPGAYDFRKQKFFNHVSCCGFILYDPVIAQKNASSLIIETLRHKIDSAIEKRLPKDTASVACALITGNKTGISKNIRSQFANSGIAHILAISGLHISIIGLFILVFVRIGLCCISKIAMFYDTKKIAAFLSLCVASFYTYLSGCSVPSIRAIIMHSMIILAILINRTALSMRSVSIAATIIMLFTPEAILFPSFQMSFGAVIAIIAFYEHNWNFCRVAKILSNIISTTLIASIPTGIFSIYVFNQLTLNSILANIIAIPLMSFVIMPLAIFSLLFLNFSISQYLIDAMGYAIDRLIQIAEYSSSLPGSYFVMKTPSDIAITILVLSSICFAIVHHKLRFVGAAGVLIGFFVYYIEATDDVFISRKGKAIGIKIDETTVAFNHLGYCRSASSSWTKSVGAKEKQRFTSNKCKKYISIIGENDAYLARIRDQTILIINKDIKKESVLHKHPDLKYDYLYDVNTLKEGSSATIKLNKSNAKITCKPLLHRAWESRKIR